MPRVERGDEVGEDLTGDLTRMARRLGFELVGAARLDPVPDRDRLDAWLEAGREGTMSYMRRHAPLRRHPQSLLPGARSVLMLGKLYNAPHGHERDWRSGPPPGARGLLAGGRAWVSRYAWGRDYHRKLRKAMRPLAALVEAAGEEARICVDSAPFLERSYARRAGLGFIGKNTCLIHPRMGSWFFLGALLTTAELAPGRRPLESLCGSCTRCLDACPTGALLPEGGLDARRCISYWTIEARGGPPERAGAADLAGQLFGCDICQDVCPYNRRAPVTADRDFWPRPQWFAPFLPDLIDRYGDDREGPRRFDLETRGSPLRRAGRTRLLQVARLILGDLSSQRHTVEIDIARPQNEGEQEQPDEQGEEREGRPQEAADDGQEQDERHHAQQQGDGRIQ